MAAMPELRPLGEALGTEALGVDLSRLDDATFAWISRLSPSIRCWCSATRHSAPATSPAFGRRFGAAAQACARQIPPRRTSGSVVADQCRGGRQRSTGTASSAPPTGTPTSTYEEELPLLAMLHALEVPSSKGGTMFADMCAAYDALPQAMKERLAGLVGLHGRTDGPAGERLYGEEKGADRQEIYRAAPPGGRSRIRSPAARSCSSTRCTRTASWAWSARRPGS